jgi:glycosyltransferase involved in cell wall biosynthesis
MRVVHNGVDVGRFCRSTQGAEETRAALGLPADGALVLLAAAHRPEKRHDRFLALIEQLHADGVRAWGVMAGDGPLLARNAALAEASPVSDWLRVMGPVLDMPTMYSAADVAVLLSDTEVFPLSLLEAQACEVPVVGMEAGGVRETLVHGQTGFVVEQGDVQGMVSAVEALLADSDRRTRMGAAGRRFVEEQLSTEATLKGYLRVLERTTETPRPSWSPGEGGSAA